MTEVAKARLPMERHGVVDHRVDPPRREVSAQGVPPLGYPDHVLVIRVALAAPGGHRQLDARNRQVLVVVRSALAAPGVPSVETRELGGKDRRLQRVQAEVAPYFGVLVRDMPAVVAEPAHAFRQSGIGSSHEPGVSHGAQVLRGIEGEAGQRAHGAGRPVAAVTGVTRSERLRRVLDHRDPMRRGQLQGGRHVGALSEQVHRNDRLYP